MRYTLSQEVLFSKSSAITQYSDFFIHVILEPSSHVDQFTSRAYFILSLLIYWCFSYFWSSVVVDLDTILTRLISENVLIKVHLHTSLWVLFISIVLFCPELCCVLSLKYCQLVHCLWHDPHIHVFCLGSQGDFLFCSHVTLTKFVLFFIYGTRYELWFAIHKAYNPSMTTGCLILSPRF